MKRFRKQHRRGASAIEFALVAPILFAVAFAFFVAGQLLASHQILTHAAREGCRKAALSTTMSEDDVRDVVREYLRKGAIPANIVSSATITVDPAPSNVTGAETLMTVSVSVPFSDVSWMPSGTYYTAAETQTLIGTCTMERE